MTRALALVALLPLAACMPKSVTAPIAGPSDMCTTAATQAFVGRAWTDGVAAELRAKTGTTTARTVRPGQMVTMEYDARRVTITLDADDRIVRVACG